MIRTVETPYGKRKAEQDSWIGTNEGIVEFVPEGLLVNPMFGKGSGEGKDDIPAGGIQKDNVAVLNADYAKSIENNLRIQEKYNKISPDLESRLGTGSIRRATLQKKKENEDIIAAAVDAQRREHEAMFYAKCGKDMPGYSGGKITGTDSRAYKRRQGTLGADEQLADPDGVIVPNVLKEPETPVVPETAPTRSSSWGGIGNAIASGLTALGGLSQILGARNQSLSSPTTYAPNQYKRQALTTMASRRANVYPQLQAMRDVEARNRWAVRNSGGLTGAQKYLANVASGIGLQRNYASVIDAANQLNNQYRGEWANMASSIGTQNAQRLQNSNQYRDEAYARAHGARTQMEQVGMFNMLNAIQQFYANEFKRHQFERTMGLYDQDYRYNKSYV